jgi:hypothetical protein
MSVRRAQPIVGNIAHNCGAINPPDALHDSHQSCGLLDSLHLVPQNRAVISGYGKASTVRELRALRRVLYKRLVQA